MQLLSVNLGQERSFQFGQQTLITSIFKEPTNAPVEIGSLGLKGDHISDLKNHGGPDQAVYIYGGGDYAWWAAELARALPAPSFGENLTISDLNSAEFHIGDRLHIGTTLLEVSVPRIPCVKLAMRMNDPAFVKRFRAAERPGLYCRVIEPGLVQVGNAVTVQPYAGEQVGLVEVFRAYFEHEPDEAEIVRILRAPIDARSRTWYEERLATLRAGSSSPSA